MDMREDMLTLPKGTIPSKQIMARFQNRLKAKGSGGIIQGIHPGIGKAGCFGRRI